MPRLSLAILRVSFRAKSARAWICLLFALAFFDIAKASAVTLVYHSLNDDGVVGFGLVPVGGVQSVYLYIDGGALASGAGTACNDGTGDEVCGFTFEINAITGLTLSSFTPDAGANLLVNLSPTSIRINGLDTQAPTPGPHRLGELLVNSVAGGRADLVSGEVIGASLASETLATTTVIIVPEPGFVPLLASGTLMLVGMQRRRAGQ
jgi:hypothetical protein